jgi:LCP family protein required for cell wall assembly
MSGPAATTGTEPTEPSTRWRGFWGRCLIAVVVASAFMGSAVALVDRGITDRVQKIRRVHLTLASVPPGGANYLIIGSDTRSFVDNSAEAAAFGDPNSDPNVQGQRSDTLMVAHVEPSAQRTFVVSFPRDLIVNVPTVGRTRINAAYATGGPQLVIDTLKANFDIDISHYLEVDFKSFQEIVNEIGNIGVYLPGTVRDPETGLYTPYGKGCYALDGASALAYVRSRTLQVADPNGPIVDEDGQRWRLLDQRADLDRIQRQQSFIRKLAGLAISKALSDPFLAVSLADNVIGYLKADQNLSRDDVNALIRAFKTVDVNDPNSVRFETLPVDPDPENPNVTLVPAAAADAVVAQLRTFGDDTPKPPTVPPSKVTVHVTDATGTNVAPSVVTELAAQGFHASQAKTTTTTIPVTEVHYGYGQAEEAKALLAYFPDAKFVPDANAKDAVELVLGTSFAGDITVPSTTTTVPATTAPGAPATTAPAAPTTTEPATTTTTDPTAACPD